MTERQKDQRADSERRRRLAEVFGDVLPDTTSDERSSSEADGARSSDHWYLENRPPHHG
ncbi:hypothetical protein [Parasphingorhabdus pacifica]